MPETTSTGEPEFAAYVAIDWANREHAWTLEVPGGAPREKGKLPHTPEAIDAWAVTLADRFRGRPVAVALEQARGALLYALTKYGHLVLFPIHPSTSSRYRAAVFPSGAKDDPTDAGLLLDLLVRHRDRLRRLQPDTEQTRKLKALVEKRRQLVDEQTAQTNRVTDLLKLYFPQALRWLDELASPLAIAFLQRWPTLPQLKQEDPEVLQKFFYQHGSRSQTRIQTRLREIRQARPAIEDQAIIDPAVLMVQALLQLVSVLRSAIATIQQAIDTVFGQHPDATIFSSFPGAGQVMAPRLLAAFGSRRDRWGSAIEVQSYTGIAPVTSRSGDSQWIHFRWACPKFLRQTFHEFARLSIPHCQWAHAFYHQQRTFKRKAHHAAVRSLAYKWLRILYRCWRDRIPYQEDVYQQRLQQSVPSRLLPPAGRPTPKIRSNPVDLQFKNINGFWKLSDTAS